MKDKETTSDMNYACTKRKISEDSVVLSREEYDCLKRIEKAYDPFWFCSFGGCESMCKECKYTCEMSIFVKERKKTAEKLIKFVSEHCDNETLIWQLDEFVTKQFSVEIKEQL